MLSSGAGIGGGGHGVGNRDEEFSALTEFDRDERSLDSDAAGEGTPSKNRQDRDGRSGIAYGILPRRLFRRIKSKSGDWSVSFAVGTLLLGLLLGTALDRRYFRRRDVPGAAPVVGGKTGAVVGWSSSSNDDDDAADDDSPSFDEEDDDGASPSTLGSNMTKSDGPIPPLSSLVRGSRIVGDVSWLLDFAVVDFPKCGTTFLMNYLAKADETYINHGEVCSMDRHRPYKVVNRYYPFHRDRRYTDDGRRIKYGLKCPEELETEYALDDYVQYFPKIKFVVTVRHPVLWFQSYYNFRAYNSYPLKMPPTDELIGPCMEGYPYVPWNCSHHCPSGNMKVCTDRAKFHHALSRLGKTPMDTPEERALLGHGMRTVRTSNKVFLMENRQIIKEHPSSQSFPEDLRDFLELETDLAPLKHFERRPDRYDNAEAFKERINICDPEHAKARRVLVQHGRDAAQWITEYFLRSPDVVVTSRERFVELLDDWGTDPCNDDDPNKLLRG